MMKIEIITPDRKVFEGDIKSVRVPGKKGSFQVLKDHAPIVSTLENGPVIMVDQAGNETRYEINGGVIEVKMNKIILLAESVQEAPDMTPDEFRKHAHELVDWMAGYMENVEEYPVKSSVKPGEIFTIPDNPPLEPESFESFLKDFEEIIMPGISHWQSPNFFAYFPANTSPPSILAEMLTSTLGRTMHDMGDIAGGC